MLRPRNVAPEAFICLLRMRQPQLVLTSLMLIECVTCLDEMNNKRKKPQLGSAQARRQGVAAAAAADSGWGAKCRQQTNLSGNSDCCADPGPGAGAGDAPRGDRALTAAAGRSAGVVWRRCRAASADAEPGAAGGVTCRPPRVRQRFRIRINPIRVPSLPDNVTEALPQLLDHVTRRCSCVVVVLRFVPHDVAATVVSVQVQHRSFGRAHVTIHMAD